MSDASENKNMGKVIGVGAGVLGAAYLLYLLLKKPAPQDKFTSSTKSLFKTNIRQLQKMNIKKQALSAQVVNSIHMCAVGLSLEEYKQLIIQSRNQRRRCLDDKQQYCQIIAKTELEDQALYQKYLGALLDRLQITAPQWQKAEKAIEKINDETEKMKKQVLLNGDSSIVSVPYKKLENISEFKLNKLAEMNLREFSEEEPGLIVFVSSYLEDLAYAEFGLEEEQLFYARSRLNQNLQEQLESYKAMINFQIISGMMGA